MKKFLRVLLLIVLFMGCGIFAACGDNYKNLDFEVYYSTTGQDGTWQYAEDGNISFFYGGENSQIGLTESNGKLVGKVFLKVCVTGVKDKYIDKILVQNNGNGSNIGSSLIAAGTLVDNDTPFALNVSLDDDAVEGDYIKTTFKFTETSSNKSSTSGFSITPNITDIKMSNQNTLAVVVGDSAGAQLSGNYLNFVPTCTIQTGVVYTLEDVGKYNKVNEMGNDSEVVWVKYNQSTSAITVSDTGRIIVASNYSVNDSNYIARVRATSTTNPEIWGLVDVFILPQNQTNTLTMTYSNGNSFNNDNSFTLYCNSGDFVSAMGGTLNFGSAHLKVTNIFSSNNAYISGNYGNGLLNRNGKYITYGLNVYVGDLPYVINSQHTSFGLEINEENGIYEVIAKNANTPKTKVEFKYEPVGVDYNRANNNAFYSKTLSVSKKVMATSISLDVAYGDQVDNHTLLDNSSVNIKYYSSNSAIGLTLNALPNDVSDLSLMEFSLREAIASSETISISSQNVLSGGGTNITWQNLNQNEAQVIVALPYLEGYYYEGNAIDTQTIRATINLRYVVTADEVFAYAGYDSVSKDGTTPISSANLGGAINITDTGSVYYKVLHTNYNLDQSTLILTSTNSAIKFVEGEELKSSISLNGHYVSGKQIKQGETVVGYYSIFKVDLASTAIGAETTISVSVADGYVNLPSSSNQSIKVRSVYLADEGSLNVSSMSTGYDAINVDSLGGDWVINNGITKFAVVAGLTHQFKVLDETENSAVIRTLKINTENTGYEGFSTGALGQFTPNMNNEWSNNTFSFRANVSGYTQRVKVLISYYKKINGIVAIAEKEIVCEFAVYTPITNIIASVDNNPISYVDGFEEGSTATITYQASNLANVTRSLCFTNYELNGVATFASNISSISVKYIDANGKTSYVDALGNLKLDSTIRGVSFTNLQNASLYNLKGQACVQLTDEISVSGASVILTINRLGKEVDSTCRVEIVYKTYEPATKVVVEGECIDNNTIVNNSYIFLSDLTGQNVANITAYATWENTALTNLQYTQLGSKLYKYEQNADGSFVLDNGKPVFTPYNLGGISVEGVEDGNITITAYAGGVFKLVIHSMDSYSQQTGDYETYKEVLISVADGSVINPYLIKTGADLKALSSESTANTNNYVLANNITADLKTKVNGEFEFKPITNFNGSLTGSQQFVSGTSVITKQYLLSVLLDAENAVDGNSALFATLGTNANIFNIDVDATIFGTTTASNVGVIAGVNNGVINGANLLINGQVKIKASTNFGALVGTNNKTVVVKNSGIVQNGTLFVEIETFATPSTINIGGVAGKNLNTIRGEYLGKDSLNSANYSVIANYSVLNKTQSNIINVGGVAGLVNQDANPDVLKVKNLLVGGQIVVQNSTEVSANTYLGGVAGYAVADAEVFTDCAALGLDLACPAGVSAGIVAKSENGVQLRNCRVMFANVKYSNITGTIYGTIEAEFAAGILAEGDNSTLTYCSVENFITENTQDFYPLRATNTVAGLTLGRANVYNSFVTANLYAQLNVGSFRQNSAILLNDGESQDSYFIGKVFGVENFATANYVYPTRTANDSYAVLLFENGFYSALGSTNNFTLKDAPMNIIRIENSELFLPVSEVLATASNVNGLFIKNNNEYQLSDGFSETELYFKKVSGKYYATKVTEQNFNAITRYIRTDSYVQATEFDPTAVYYVENAGVYELPATEVSSENFNNDTYYTMIEGEYVVATAFDANAKYYTLVDNFYNFANYELTSANTITSNNQTYKTGATYYNVAIPASVADSTIYIRTEDNYTTIKNLDTLDLTKEYRIAYVSANGSSAVGNHKLHEYLLSNVFHSYTNNKVEVWDRNIDYNQVKIGQHIMYLPYLLYNRKPLQIIAPNDIDVSINQNFVISISSVYEGSGVNFEVEDVQITETVLVNFFDGNANTNQNTHNLLTTSQEEGLLSVNILPSSSDVTGGVAFSVLSGQAEIVGNRITFKQVSKEPVIVQCYSLFNSSIKKYAAFFVQYGASNLTMDVAKPNYETDYILNLPITNNAEIAGVNLTFNTTNIFNGSAYKSIVENGSAELKNCLSIVATQTIAQTGEAPNETTGMLNITPTGSLGVSINTGSVAVSSQFNVEFTLQLDAAAYFGNQYFSQDKYIKLASCVLRVECITGAEKISTASGQVEFSGTTQTTFPMAINLQTSYVNATRPKFETILTKATDNEIVMVGSDDEAISYSGMDGLNLKFTTADLASQEELSKLILRAGVNGVADLFNPVIVSSSYVVGYGYEYKFNLMLLEKFTHRFIEKDIVLNVEVYAQSNPEIKQTLKLTLTPSMLSGDPIVENYAVDSSKAANGYQSILHSSIDTSIIEPGSLGGVMVIRIQPSYADVVSATLVSSPLYVASLGRNVYVRFEQVVYEGNGYYRTLVGSQQIEQGGNIVGIELQKKSSINKDGEFEYDGNIYIHTFLEGFAGVEENITATLTVNTRYETKVVTKTLTTKFLPGASLEYSGITQNGGYLIQENSANTLDVVLVGYEFNALPNISAEWMKFDSTINGFVSAKDSNKADAGNGYTTYLTDEEILEKITAIKNASNETEKNSLIEALQEIRVYSDEYYDENGKVIYASSLINYYTDYSNLWSNMVGNTRVYHLPIKIVIGQGLPSAFKIKVSLSLNSQTVSAQTQDSYKIFVPTDYIISGISINSLTGGTQYVKVHENKTVELSLKTNSDSDYTTTLNQKLVKDIGAENFKNLFKINNYPITYENYSAYFTPAVQNNMLTLLGAYSFRPTINLTVYYHYVFDPQTGRSSLQFAPQAVDGGYSKQINFALVIYENTSEKLPKVIDSAEAFVAMASGENYILTKDIYLENFTPISANIASLDGNNRVIYINSFAVSEERTNYGLFENLSTYEDEAGVVYKSILKNVIVAYTPNHENNFELNLTNSSATNIVFGGLVAENAGGLIYNCDVMNLSSTGTEYLNKFNIYVKDDGSTKLTFGGLVGKNNGIITNSRVGRLNYTRISVNANEQSSTSTIDAQKLNFGLGNANELSNNLFVAKASAFVAENGSTGIISGCYVANTSVINYAVASSTRSQTAGFVAENAGRILYSYVKGNETTINGSQAYATGATISDLGNGNASGFVYTNTGSISNCFANIEVSSTSGFVSGFVFNNQSDATISESYAACTLNSGLNKKSAVQPFVGVSDNDISLSDGKLTNAYFYNPNSSVSQISTSKDRAVGLNTLNIQNSKNLLGFAFVESENLVERMQGAWSYYVAGKYNQHILPEINTANIIAVSHRYKRENPQDGSYYFVNAGGLNYEQGSTLNPYIVRDANEFNEVFAGAQNSSFVGNVRLINDLDLSASDISTRADFSLGNKNSTYSTFEGNGLTISGIKLDAPSPSTKKVGLFGEINNAYVKNIKLNFYINSPSTMRASHVGGLAGEISNSVVSNISLNGAGLTLRGTNFVGGLAGAITGSSVVQNIDTNLNAIASGSEDAYQFYNMYYSQADFEKLQQNGYKTGYTYSNYLTTLSFAGGLAGIIDVSPRGLTEYNLAFININANQFTNALANGNIVADYAGGVAGYANSETSATRLKYNVGSSDKISGGYAAGGLFGVSAGKIIASQVTVTEQIQMNYDDNISQYLINIQNSVANPSLQNVNIGNRNLVESNTYAGGLIGIGLGNKISYSYSRASLTGTIMGGLIGVGVASGVNYSYAMPYLNLTNQNWINAGGLIGQAYAYGVNDEGTDSDYLSIKEYAKVLELKGSSAGVNITSGFGSFVVDLGDKNNLLSNGTVSYTIAKSVYEKGTDKVNAVKSVPGLYEGKLNGVGEGSDAYNQNGLTFATTDQTVIAPYKDLAVLYYSKPELRVDEFNSIFASWLGEYWSAGKYLPLLIEYSALDTIPIQSAEDLKKIKDNPTGHFTIIGDENGEIDLTNYNYEGNYVLDMEFRGTLTGDTTSSNQGKMATIKGITINAEYETDSGFFRATNGATITNIKFEYGSKEGDNQGCAGNTVKEDIGYFGGVSSNDSCSKFTNIYVCSASNKAIVNESVVQGTQSHILTTENNGSIKGFGGIVGRASDSSITNCYFSGSVEATVKTDDTNKANIGGLIGYGDATFGVGNVANLTISGCEVGLMKNEGSVNIDTYFNLNLNDSNGTISIGGAVGSAQNANVASITAGDSSNNIEFNISGACPTLNVGGIAGALEKSFVNSSTTENKINIGSDKLETSANLGGLVGYLTSEGGYYISNNFAKTEMDLSSLSGNVSASLGVGYAYNATINSSLFYGSINSEEGSSGNSGLGNVVAGGAVGTYQNDTSLNQILTYGTITLGGTSAINFAMGGLVGQIMKDDTGRLSISNSESAVRLIPYGGGENSTTSIYIGGLVGEAGKTTVNLNISLSSIHTDGLNNSLLTKFLDNNKGINALFGSVSSFDYQENTCVVYSTDIALFAESLDNGENGLFNYSAQTMSYEGGNGSASNSWKRNFARNSGWEIMLAGVPYPLSVKAYISRTGLIDNSGALDVYSEGTVFNPKKITDSNTTALSAYSYYIITNENLTALNEQFNPQNSEENKEFNGFIIGPTNGITIPKTPLLNSAYISVLGKHSAVSNIHLQFEEGSTINISKGVDNGGESYAGLIVSLNQGTVSNCSIQGTGLAFASSANRSGLIVGRNEGLVDLCYSSAEIKNCSAQNFAGIVSCNAGKVYSCYFTGYINNSNAAAGIAINANSDAQFYNCYMAGVVVKKGSNGFIHDGNVPSNNLVDKYANNESSGADTIVDTIDLIKASKLVGNWETTINNNRIVKVEKITEGENAGQTIITVSKYYGYNYNYPIYKLSRRQEGGVVKDNTFSLYTGTGREFKYNYTINGLEPVDFGADNGERVGTLVNSNSNEYADAFKIPHPGVLNTLKLIDLDLNYVIIYDMSGATWSAIGGGDEGEIGRFTGVVVSNKYYSYNSQSATDDARCTISNFSGESLFTNVADSSISFIKLAGEFVGNTGDDIYYGILIKSTSNTSGNKILLSNIEFVTTGDDSNTKGVSIESNKNVAGLIGQINSDTTVAINKLTTIGGEEQRKNRIVISGKEEYSAALIAAINSGSIEITNSANLYVKFSGSNSFAGGLVGKNEGTISGGSDTACTKIYISTDSASTLAILGGIVYESVGEESEISNITVVYETYAGTQIKAESIGYLCAKNSGKTQFNNCGFDAINKDDPVCFSAVKNFGLFASNNTAELTVSAFMSPVSTITFQIANTLDEDGKAIAGAIGNLVGQNSGKITAIVGNLIQTKLCVVNIKNVGGLVGKYKGGKIVIAEYDNNNPISTTLEACYNVGGAFGLADGEVNSEICSDVIDTGKTIWKFLKTESLERKFVAININNEAQNVGGLIGSASASLSDLININPINVCSVESLGVIKAQNIGGVVGCAKADLTNLTNKGQISCANDNYEYNNEDIQFKIKGSNSYPIYTLNVGGIAGYAENSTIKGCNNTAEIKGYQNVGGIIGYANNCMFDEMKTSSTPGNSGEPQTLSNTTENENSNNTAMVQGVISVGGVVGLAKGGSVKYVVNNANVYGNANVGGLVGYIYETTLKGVVEKGETASVDVVIKGVVYVLDNGEGDVKNGLKYIPVNVGGAVGFAYYGTINGVTVNAEVKTSEEGSGDCSVVINTISNYAVSVLVDGTNLNSTYYDQSLVYLPKKDDSDSTKNPFIVNFDQMKSGFGALVGGAYQTSVEPAPASEEQAKTNRLKNVKVNAPLGVNVGTLFGYYNCGGINDLNTKMSNINIEGNVAINGAYNIGGVVGYLDKSGYITIEQRSTKQILKSSSGNAMVELQNRTAGFYVGGLIGKMSSAGSSSGSNDTLILSNDGTIKIEINTGSSYYMGGLLGRYEVAGATSANFNGMVGDNNGNNGKVTTSNINDNFSINEFGGLIGMVKVEKSYNPATVNISGTHQYAFTVNTIQNGNYAEGATTYKVQDNSDIYLIAQAFYVNQDNFNISPSSNTDWYNVEKYPNLTSPLRNDAWGWAKEYTMFKTLQRNIPASENSGIWDAIAPIYDAKDITMVATIGNASKWADENWPTGTNAKLQYGQSETKDINDDKNKGYICFTIYEDVEGSPKLYSRIGVAQLYDGEKRKNEYKDGSETKINQPDNKSINSSEIAYFNWGAHNFNGIEKKEIYKVLYTPRNTIYNNGITKSGEKSKPNDNKFAAFEFGVLFNNTSNSGFNNKSKDNKNPYEVSADDDDLPDDGSLFNVRGVSSQYKWAKEGSTKEKKPWWRYLLEGLKLVAGAVALFTPVGWVGLGVCAAVWIGSTVALSLCEYYGVFIESHAAAGDTFFERTDQTYGIMSGTYSRELKYKVGGNNNMILYAQNDTLINVDGVTYFAYSTTKPSDYYSNYYYICNSGEIPNNISGEEILKYEFTTPLNKNDYTASMDKCYKIDTINVKKSLIVKTYQYKNGMYYVASIVSKTEYSPYQITTELLSPGQDRKPKYYEDCDYVQDGYYYVRGSWDKNSNTYSVNNAIGDNTVAAQKSSITSINKTVEKPITFGPKPKDFNTTTGYAEGYAYMEGATYAAAGTNLNNDGYVKCATFEKYDESVADLNVGIDFIWVMVKGQQVPYKIKTDEISESSDGIDYDKLGQYNVDPETLRINIYPYSFDDPSEVYKISILDTDIGDLKDTNTYVNNAFAGGTDDGITKKATFYYYDGGYIKNNEISGGIYEAFIPVNDEEKSVKIPIYDEDGNMVKEDGEDGVSIKNIGSCRYRNCYITNPKDENLAGNFTDKTNFKVSAWYKVENNKIYKKSTKLFNKDGILQSATTQFGSSVADYNNNKYLTNSTYQIYTRYRFIGGSLSSSDKSEWSKDKDKKYYAFMTGYYYPNPGKTTYLVESVIVTLGCGGKCTDGSNEYPVGTISLNNH